MQITYTFTLIRYRFWLVYLIVFLPSIIHVESGSIVDKYITKNTSLYNDQDTSNKSVSRFNDTRCDPMEAIMPLPKIRAKRQSGAGKYTDAAKMPQVKVLRLMLQMVKNAWDDVYVGGAHPFHHEVPKPVVKLYKSKIIDFFFPKVGDEYKD